MIIYHGRHDALPISMSSMIYFTLQIYKNQLTLKIPIMETIRDPMNQVNQKLRPTARTPYINRNNHSWSPMAGDTVTQNIERLQRLTEDAFETTSKIQILWTQMIPKKARTGRLWTTYEKIWVRLILPTGRQAHVPKINQNLLKTEGKIIQHKKQQ